jgi:hypothetical protein
MGLRPPVPAEMAVTAQKNEPLGSATRYALGRDDNIEALI